MVTASKLFFRRLTIGVVLLNITIITLAVISIQQLYYDNQERTEISSSNIAQVLAQEINSTIDRIDLALSNIADNVARESAPNKKMDEILATTLTRLPDIDSIGMTDATGDIVIWTGSAPSRHISIGGRDYFQTLKSNDNTGMIITKPLRGSITGKWQMVFARRLNQPDGTFGGVVYAVIMIERIVNMFSSLDIGEHGKVALQTDDFTTIIRYPESNGIKDEIENQGLSQKYQDIIKSHPETGTYTVNMDPIYRTISYRKIGNHALYIFVDIAADDDIKEWRDIVLKISLLVILFILATMASLRIFYRHQKAAETYLADLEKNNHSLQVSESRYRGLIETQIDMVLRLGVNNAFTFANETTCRVLGVRREALLGQNWQTFVNPDDVAATATEIAAALSPPYPRVRVENRILTGDGERWYAWEGTLVIRNSEKAMEVQAVGRDITEMKQALGELRAAKEQADAANSAKSAFLAMMSHEIRTPLTGIMGMADLMLEEEAPTRQKDGIQTLRSSAKLLTTILNDVLDFSKIESGTITFECEVFEIRLELAKAISLFSANSSKNRVDMVAQVADDVPDCAAGDPIRIRQILHNLIGNAVKFTEKGNIVIRVTVCPEDDDAQEENAITLKFEIIDTGIGLSPEQRQGLFQPFSQAHGSLSRRLGGTGLGLAISKRLVELMHGRIGVESVLGQGSTFWFTIRLNRASRPVVNLVEPIGLNEPWGLDILVAEDNPTNQKVIKAMLTKRGHKVEVAENGKIAFDLLSIKCFDLVLMDIQMPVMDGVTATKNIRETRFFNKDIPIIALTADVVQERRQKYLDAGMNDVISKPIDWHQLIIKINDAVASSGKSSNKIGDGNYNIIDADKLESITDAIGLSEMKEFITEFCCLTENDINNVEDALVANDQSKVKRLCHTIKGVAGNIGALRLRDAISEVEKVAGEPNVALPRLENVKLSFSVTKRYLTTKFNNGVIPS